LFLIDILYGLAGAEGALLRATRLLPKDRYRCTVATFRGRPEMVDLFECPVRVFPLEKAFSVRSLSCAARLYRFIREERVDVVHTLFQAADLWGGIVSRLSRRVVLISSRRDLGFMRSFKQRVAYRLLGPLYDEVQAVSEQVRQFSITADHLDPQKVVTVPNGIELSEGCLDRATVRAALGILPATPVIISVGHIRHIKGTDLIVDTAELVCKKEPSAVFLIVGSVHEADLYDRLTKRIHNVGLSNNIRFLGRRSDIRDLLGASDIFCLLSRSEGMSNALLEGMAAGLPCVVSSAGGNPEVVLHDESGLLVPVGNPALAARAIRRLLGDKVLARRLGRNARSRAEQKFSARAMVDRMAASYQALVTRRENRGCA
jgi:glycosyltransferase involved in cell wall biosynthesis